MILTKILEPDLHLSRKAGPIPIMWGIEIPGPHCLPIIVSRPNGKFHVMEKAVGPEAIWRRLGKTFGGTQDTPNTVAVGVFKYPDEIDGLIRPLMQEALNLSLTKQYKNCFSGPRAAELAFSYVRESSATESQPHAVLIPRRMSTASMFKFLGQENFDEKLLRFKKHCAVITCDVPSVVFCSRADFVGLVTKFIDGSIGIVLHNVKDGLAFCSPTELCISSTDSSTGPAPSSQKARRPQTTSGAAASLRSSAPATASASSAASSKSTRRKTPSTRRPAATGRKKASGATRAASPGGRRAGKKTRASKKVRKPGGRGGGSRTR